MSLQATLTWRYALALCLVAGVLLCSYAVIVRQQATGTADGALINRAGMQRMLSQRIALLAVELTDEDTSTGRASRLAASLETAVRRMEENHAELSARGLAGSDARAAMTDPDAIYFGEDHLDARVRELLSAAGSLLRYHREDATRKAEIARLARDQALTRRITSLALGSLPDDLDDVVHRYEDAFELGQHDMLRLETGLLLFALLVLLSEAIIIYRPTVRRMLGALRSAERGNVELMRSNAELERVNGELREFTHLLSHDLRAPVSSSRGLVSFLDESLARGDIDDARHLTGRVEGALLKLDALINDLTNVVQAGHLHVDPEPTDLHALVDEVVASMSHMPGADAISINTVATIDRPVVVKRVHLRSALENLVSNAIKYADPDKPDSHLKLSITRNENGVRIDANDNGLGVPEPFRAQLFKMFKRFHSRIAPGSGLGLYLVEVSMRAIDGRVDYEPIPGGSRFSLTFDDHGTMPV